jgi:dTDP-4-amino-4,6-dideoxygalactose transaminase
MIKLAEPNIPEKAIEKAVEVLRSGNLVQGKYVKEFENSLCNYLNIKNAVVVSSGTAALHLSLLSLDIKEGDEVIVPAFTFPATANVVELVGAKPIFVDIKLDDYCINTTKIKEKITSKTKVIILVHEFGHAAKMDEIIKIAKHYNLKIVEDAACALGAEFGNQKVGTFGDIGCFSFHPRKAITTGEGGVIVTNNDELAEKLRVLRNHGISHEDGKIDFIAAGLNYRMTDFQAALGLEQMKYLDDDIKNRIELAKEYNKQLSDIEWIKTPELFDNRRMVYQTYHILVDDKINRDVLIAYLREKNIEVNYGAQALNCVKFYKEKYRLTSESNPNATNAFYKGIALPMGNHISSENMEYISNILKAWGH